MTATKRCCTCREYKPISRFGKDRQVKDGLSRRCKQCNSVRNKIWYKEHPERKLSVKRYSDSHKNEVREKVRKWNRAHPERVMDKVRKWIKANPEKYKAHNAVAIAVRARKLAPVRTTKCVRCNGQASQYHHHKGYSKENQLNVVPVCVTCHRILEDS